MSLQQGSQGSQGSTESSVGENIFKLICVKLERPFLTLLANQEEARSVCRCD